MALLVIGVLLLLAKLAGLSPFVDWSWWVVAAPFIGAALWWTFIDMSGITARRVADKLDERKEQRRVKAMEALGLNTKRQRQVSRAHRDANKLAAMPRRPLPDAPPAAPDGAPEPTPERRDPRI
jgi:small Trp-rich protein